MGIQNVIWQWFSCFSNEDKFVLIDDGRSENRICTVSGPPDKVQNAINMIQRLLPDEVSSWHHIVCVSFITYSDILFKPPNLLLKWTKKHLEVSTWFSNRFLVSILLSGIIFLIISAIFLWNENSESSRIQSEQVKNDLFKRRCRWLQLCYIITRIIPILWKQ